MGHEFTPESITLRAGAVIVGKGLQPDPAHPGDAAYDLTYAGSEKTKLYLSEPQLFPTGVWAAIPEGHVGLVCSRSGLALKNGIFVLNAPGIIDSSYRGEIGVVLMNLAYPPSYTIVPGMRIAQLLILATSEVLWLNNARKFDSLTTQRGADGFGSTDKLPSPINSPFHTAECDRRDTHTAPDDCAVD